MERDYEEIFQKVLDYEQTLHEKTEKNQDRSGVHLDRAPVFLALLF